jgi:hypothetical protein
MHYLTSVVFVENQSVGTRRAGNAIFRRVWYDYVLRIMSCLIEVLWSSFVLGFDISRHVVAQPGVVLLEVLTSSMCISTNYRTKHHLCSV